jgi:hypothetical protein
MSKMYVKDPNGKYRLVDKETQTGTKKVETNNNINKQPEGTPEAKVWVREIMEGALYEHTNKEKIDQVIDNALYAMRETQQRIRTELMTEA